MRGQHGQAGIANRVGRLRKQNIHANGAHLVMTEQDFQQIGHALARPRPWPHRLQAGFVDVDHRHAAFGFMLGADLMQ